MRIKLELRTEKGKLIPFNHQYHLASAIYDVLCNSNPEYSKKLHDYDRHKFFTFSRLNIPRRIMDRNNGIITKDGRAYIYISSPDDEFMKNFIDGLLNCYGELDVGGIKFMPNNLIVEKIPEEFKILKTLSPVYLRMGDKENDKIIDILPDDGRFYEYFKNNLINKYERFYGKCDYDFDFEIRAFKKKRVELKGIYHRCSELVFKVEGDYELIKFGYECGFGEKTSMGFGMCKV
ncbi:CRISPR-associated endoribonuclease Cas6 [Methanothermococcus sp.]|uniref:CRISPR-associated endoribonuclease Cas6 n=1 Tax=Methanothermococcus sp. TaxID=2614238 RepID=UPI0025DE3F95|nr:CRISPR-associated endoribonuclease Cas6 [Methanothermococcus sp.]